VCRASTYITIKACWAGNVYNLASAPNGILYVGVTSDLVRRIYEHRNGLVAGFTKRYSVKRLVYFEQHETIQAAIQREHNMKHWSRKWKVRLILANNPEWNDLYDTIVRTSYRHRARLLVANTSLSSWPGLSHGCPVRFL
jgi:putative endonuclease